MDEFEMEGDVLSDHESESLGVSRLYNEKGFDSVSNKETTEETKEEEKNEGTFIVHDELDMEWDVLSDVDFFLKLMENKVTSAAYDFLLNKENRSFYFEKVLESAKVDLLPLSIKKEKDGSLETFKRLLSEGVLLSVDLRHRTLDNLLAEKLAIEAIIIKINQLVGLKTEEYNATVKQLKNIKNKICVVAWAISTGESAILKDDQQSLFEAFQHFYDNDPNKESCHVLEDDIFELTSPFIRKAFNKYREANENAVASIGSNLNLLLNELETRPTTMLPIIKDHVKDIITMFDDHDDEEMWSEATIFEVLKATMRQTALIRTHDARGVSEQRFPYLQTEAMLIRLSELLFRLLDLAFVKEYTKENYELYKEAADTPIEEWNIADETVNEGWASNVLELVEKSKSLFRDMFGTDLHKSKFDEFLRDDMELEMLNNVWKYETMLDYRINDPAKFAELMHKLEIHMTAFEKIGIIVRLQAEKEIDNSQKEYEEYLEPFILKVCTTYMEKQLEEMYEGDAQLEDDQKYKYQEDEIIEKARMKLEAMYSKEKSPLEMLEAIKRAELECTIKMERNKAKWNESLEPTLKKIVTRHVLETKTKYNEMDLIAAQLLQIFTTIVSHLKRLTMIADVLDDFIVHFHDITPFSSTGPADVIRLVPSIDSCPFVNNKKNVRAEDDMRKPTVILTQTTKL
eukprot:GHVL01034761.1.p1 GENE.GHVL01034761.1~~GHVL01034761.1.p1  ORF type:complete len:686 (+),score=146.52 GHVL01034761.1:161-2218(+)